MDHDKEIAPEAGLTRPAGPPAEGGAGDRTDALHVRVGGNRPVTRRSAVPRVGNLTTFRSFGNPTFRLYYASTLSHMAAMNMQMVAQSLLAYRLTGSAAILGFIALANAVPMLLLSLSGGLLADRIHKKYVLLVGQLVSAALPFIVGLTLNLGYLSEERSNSWWILAVVAMLQGAVASLVMPSRSSLVGEIVRSEQLMNAVSLSMAGMNFFRLVSPAIAGFLIELFGFAAAYYTMAALYLIGAALVLPLPLTGSVGGRTRRALAEIRDGFRYVRTQANVLLILGLSLLAVILSFPYMTLLPVFTEDILDVGAGGLGTLVSMSGAGAILGSIVLASLPDRRRGLLLGVSCLVLSIALVGFAFSTSWPLSLTLMAFVGLGHTARMALANALLMYYTEEEYRGRVMSIYMMEFGLSSLAAFVAGIMADSVGVAWSVGGLAMVLVAVSIGVLAFSPRLRRMP